MEKLNYKFMNVMEDGEAIVTALIHADDAERDAQFEAYKRAVKSKFPNNTVAWMEI